jgi:UDP-N-acetylglucosamine--N-acetylmuramyl-(pentapeptide) pyrophosphoryl-undecaprenol N-acetylglucosamine transferase
MKQRTFKILFAAGGTGGHLFPAIAVAEQLQQMTEGHALIEFVGTADRIEATIVPKHHYRFNAIPMAGLQKVLSLSTLKLPFNILRSILLTRKTLQRLQPDCVVCAGAYLSYPVGLAAAQMKIPLYLMESNAVPGKTILQLAPRAKRLCLSFAESVQYFNEHDQRKAIITGNPIRASFGAASMPMPAEARRLFGLAPDKPTLLCFGGSLGARSINQAVEAEHTRLNAAGVQILWQTGKTFQPSNQEHSSQAHSSTSAQTIVLPFIDNMAAAYTAADVVVCRAGATTIAELASIGKAAVFVPFPQAANDHQTANARALADAGAARMLRDDELSAQLVDTVLEMLRVVQDPLQAASLAERIRQFAKPDAARRVAQMLLDDARWKKE